MSRRQDCTSGSSTEAEVIAASTTSNDVVWGVGLLDEYGHTQHEPVVLNVDNSNILALADDLIATAKTRHIGRRDMIVRERQENEVLRLKHVSTENNLADVFTKGLEGPTFLRLRRLIMQILAVGYSFQRMLTRKKNARKDRSA